MKSVKISSAFFTTLFVFSLKSGIGGTSLIDAIQRLNQSVVEQILDGPDCEKHLNEVLDDGSGPLHLATRISDSDDGYRIFKMLLKSGSCPQQVNKLLETPIHDSCYIKNIQKRNEVIEDLLLHGGRLLQEDASGKTIIERLIDMEGTRDLEGFCNRFGYLISDEDYKRSLDFAGKEAGQGRGFTDLAKLLNKYQGQERIPLTIFDAIILGDFDIFKIMASKNPSLVSTKEDRWGFSPLMVATLRSNRKMIEYLLKNGASLSIEDKYGRTPLHIAAEGCIEISLKREFVRMLINKGANKDKEDMKKRSAISVGLKKGLGTEVFDIKEIRR